MEKSKNIFNSCDNKAKIVIIGTGFAGIAAAIRLQQEGENDFIILEREGDVGGVWRDNQYPGCACDVESHLYSFSFAPNPNWSEKFAPQSEIYSYLKKCVKQYELIGHIYFRHEVIRMDWNDNLAEWSVKTNNRVFKCSIVIGAFGALSNPVIPKLKGIEKFRGDAFHSANWPKDYNPKGKRVAVIGTGASAIQLIPSIQPDVASLYVFQRTAPWVLPRLDGVISQKMRNVYKKIPVFQRIARMKLYIQLELRVIGLRNPTRLKSVEKKALKHIYKTINDPILREKLSPNYRIGCKRILLSNTYYPALARHNVSLNTAGINEVTEDSVIDSQGNNIEVDTIIFATGFQAANPPYAHGIYGKLGHSLSEEWGESPKAYMGETIAGFPNLFILQGPNTGLGHSSVILMIEAQVEHMIKVLKHMDQKNFNIMEISADAQSRFVNEIDKSMEGVVWKVGGCTSWYLDKTGRNSTLWPEHTFSFRRKAIQFHSKDYIGRHK